MSEKLVMRYWDCKYCGTAKIKGTSEKCPYCSAPKNKDTVFYMSEEIVYLTEEEAETKGKGADWHCAYCDSLNSTLETNCNNCGANREQSSKDYFQLRKEAKRKELEESEMNYPSETMEYIEDKEEIIHEEMMDDALNNYMENIQNTYNNKKAKTNVKENISDVIAKIFCATLVTGLIGLFIFGMIWLFMPKELNAEVTSCGWEYTIDIQELKTVDENGWSLPVDARLHYTNKEIHHYDKVIDHYETKTRTWTEKEFSHNETKTRTYTECEITGYTTETDYIDNGDGTATEKTRSVPVYGNVTKTETYLEPVYKDVVKTETYQDPVYKDVPVYKTKYYYEIDKWVYCRTVKTSENNKEPYWGLTNLKEKEREGSRNEKYFVKLYDTKSKEKVEEIYLLSYDLWKTINIGDKKVFKTSFNTITEIIE